MSTLRPMLASLSEARLDDPQLVYEPKYDGIRAIVEVTPGGGSRLWSRLGNDKTHQFPEVASALDAWGRRLKHPVVIDGELVALDSRGEPAGFQQLQGRIHRSDVDSETADGGGRVALIAFDFLRDGSTDLRDRPLLERRAALEKLFGKTGSPLLRISDIVHGDGRALYERAIASGWEGLIAKQASSKYVSGKRTPDWRKLKIVHEQEFVVAGWTEPRNTRSYFGALILGVYDRPGRGTAHDLTYVGHIGTGFNERELARVMALLKPLETKTCPFQKRPPSNETPHWVRPKLVAQVKFTEWTTDGRLRHPVYLGLRDDKDPRDVVREAETRFDAPTSDRRTSSRTPASTTPARVTPAKATPPGRENPGGAPVAKAASVGRKRATIGRRSKAASAKAGASMPPAEIDAASSQALIDQLNALEESRRDDLLTLPDGGSLKVSNLHKIFWPKQKLTKGDLFRHYVRVAAFLLPAVADRPLVMKRFPNGITAPPFYQHRAEDTPEGVRVETIGVVEKRPQMIGGNLKTLLYMTQLAAISQDPWFSRVSSPEFADYVALDLDPPAGTPFGRVLDVARWIHDELDTLGATGVPKTSGADGLHIYIPLPPKTPYDAGRIFCEIVATIVSRKHPKAATVERSVSARGSRIYIDFLQNIAGKTLATAYGARASEWAGVSTPLTWQEVDRGVRREEFTIATTAARLKAVGDLWAPLRESTGVDLSRVGRYAEQSGAKAPKRGSRR